jgi:hypothetical protein
MNEKYSSLLQVNFSTIINNDESSVFSLLPLSFVFEKPALENVLLILSLFV